MAEERTIYVCPIHPDAVRSLDSAPPGERPYCPHAKAEDPHKMRPLAVVSAEEAEARIRDLEARPTGLEHLAAVNRAVAAESELRELREELERVRTEREFVLDALRILDGAYARATGGSFPWVSDRVPRLIREAAPNQETESR